MKVVVTADVHARAIAESGTRQVNGMPTPLRDTLDVLAAVEALVKARGAGQVVIAGDLFHDRKVAPVDVLVRVSEALAHLGNDTVVVAGNHDLFDNEARVSILSALPGVHAVLRAETVQVEDKVWFRYVPYDRDLRRMEAEMRAPLPAACTRLSTSLCVLFTHAPFNQGVRGPWDYAGELTSIPLDAVAQYDLTVTGHFHQAHMIVPTTQGVEVHSAMAPWVGGLDKCSKGSVLYVGSPHPLNASQIDTLNGVWVMDLRPGVRDPARSHRISLEFVPLEGPVYREVGSAAELETLLENIDPTRLVLRAVVPNAAETARVKALATNCRAAVVTEVASVPIAPERLVVAQARGDEALLRAYLGARGAQGLLDVEQTVKVGLDLLRGDA